MHRDFKGVWIPKEVYLNAELSWTEKIFLIEVHSLDGELGCWASNAHFAEFLGIGEGAVANLVTKLKNLGLIEVEGYGKTRCLRSKVSSVDETSGQKFHKNMKLVSQNYETPIYRINNTENNTEEGSTYVGEFHMTRPPKPEKKGTRLPPDFTVTSEMLSWARAECPTIDPERETDKFRDHYDAAPGQKGVKRNWNATWRNWMRNAVGYQRNGKNQGSTSTNTERLAGYEAVFAKYRSEAEGE